MDALKIDPEFQALMPPLSPDEKAQLEAGIVADGCLSPLVVWGKIVIDGLNRYEICHRLGRGFRVIQIKLKDREDVKRWIINHQLGRRNLNESQRAMLVAMLPSLSKGRPTQEIKSANLPTYPEKAEKANVSERTIRDASTVVSDGSPALSKAVLDGKIPVSTAAKITELPKAEQNKLAEQGKVAVAQAAKRIVTKAEYEADAGTLTDQKKHVVPANKPEIVKAFQRRGEIVELMNTLSKIKHQVLKAIEEKDVLYVGITTSDWQGTVGHAREILKFQAPYVVCPMCNAQGNCRMCKDRGWITESQYAAVPRELKS